jgi:chemotaxis protein CheZ
MDNNASMYEEIKKLAALIDQAKKELAAADPQKSGDAMLQLEEVIKSTESATHNIMDAADGVQKAALGQPNEKAIIDAVMKIFEACTFQDLTSQRLTKVIKLLVEVDQRTHAMLDLFGVKTNGAAKPKMVEPAKDDSHLLNGPQVKQPSQAEIDAMFGNASAKK